MDELEISGKRYISTRRAGKDHNYHADYIGQLIRANKVEGKKVGRAWYVGADSLAAYLGKEAPVHAPFARSAKSVPKTPVEMTMPVVVDEEETEPEINEDTIQEPEVPERDVIVEEEKVETIPIYKTTREAREAKGGLRYIADEGPLIPHVKKITDEHTVVIKHAEPQPIPVKLESFKPTMLATLAKPLPIVNKKRSNALLSVRIGAVALLGIIVFAIAGLLSTHLFFTLTIDGGQSASVGYSIK